MAGINVTKQDLDQRLGGLCLSLLQNVTAFQSLFGTGYLARSKDDDLAKLGYSPDEVAQIRTLMAVAPGFLAAFSGQATLDAKVDLRSILAGFAGLGT